MQRLYKSKKSKVVDGVCGGIAEYFKVDAVIIRLIWVIATIMGAGFFGVIAYLIAMAIIPPEPKAKGTARAKETESSVEQDERFVDISLRYWVTNTIGNFWPLALIFLGIFLLSRRSS